MKRKQKKSSATINSDRSIPIDKTDDSDVSIDDDMKLLQSEDEGAEFFKPSETFVQGTKSKKKSGGFQSMGLSYPILKGILKKGYKVPTPIQRKAIPVIMEGKDVVAMARTGSGKTGAFLVPMLEKLKAHSPKVGARAIIFSPTRELAMQTLKFTKELGRHTSLKTLLVLGGEKMENQFSAIHENPDIIIATPGRFLHLVIEMDLKLLSVEYVVFDEADRLLEMGFQEQIQEVLHRLSDHRQILMFSATLPSVLVDFVKVGLTDPILIRLDVEHKLSENLKTNYLCCRATDKPAVLLHLLKNNINLKDELTVVFFATRHHIEYMKEILLKATIPFTYIYSSLDQAARKINVAKFRSKKVGVLLVTDIAARGIDIPLLDNVINYNFPAKPKLFVHRVGRVARAGRSGKAYSLVSPDEAAYLLDLHLFLGKPVTFSDGTSSDSADGICGSVPQSVIDEEGDSLQIYHNTSIDITNMVTVCDNAYKQYVKSRPAPSSESIKRVKQFPLFDDKIHPLFQTINNAELERSKFLCGMKKYRPNTTIFEIGATAKSQASAIMRQKRIYHSVVDKIRSHEGNATPDTAPPKVVEEQLVLTAASEADIQSTFTTIVINESQGGKKKSDKKKRADFKDHEHYLTHQSKEHYTEKGFGLQGTFEQDASNAVLDLTGDDVDGNRKMKNAWHWDRKKKRFMRDDEGEKKKKMKTESGVWIPKTYKSDIYKKWQERSKFSHQEEQSDDEAENGNARQLRKSWKTQKGGRKNPRENTKSKGQFNENPKSRRPPRREMKNKEEILKERRKKARMTSHQKYRSSQKGKKRMSGGGGFSKGKSGNFKRGRK